MSFYNVLYEFTKNFNDDELKNIINDKLYRVITTLEMNKE